MKSKVKPILDSQLSWLDWTPEESQEMLRRMRGEIKVKRKLSLALVFALVGVLLAVSALAVTLWKHYYEKIAQFEGEVGYFDTWNGEKRAEFVLAMQAEGVVFDQEQIKKLESKNTSDAEKAKIATDLILNRYEGMREDTITAISILEAEKGILPTWSMEDKAAYTQLLVKTKTLGYDEEMYWLPGDKDIPQEKAVSIANEAIQREFEETDENLKALTLYTELRSYADEKDHRTWHVYYMKPGLSVYDAPSEYSVWINAESEEVESVGSPARQAESGKKNNLQPEIVALDQEYLKTFKEAAPYSMEELVHLKEAWQPKLEELKKYRQDWGGFYGAFRNVIEQDIRLPEADAIPPEDARKIAEEAVLEIPGWTAEALAMYERYAEVYYHSAELGKPVYQFFFSFKRSSSDEFINKPWEDYENTYLLPLYALFGGDNASAPRYVSVRLDAQTGKLSESPVQVLNGNNAAQLEFYLIK